jgi:16S rRNA processing protein RimM
MAKQVPKLNGIKCMFFFPGRAHEWAIRFFYLANKLFSTMDELISVGKFVATFGLQGELVFKHALGKKSPLKDLKVLFVEMTKGAQLPYFVEKARATTADETLVKLEGIATKEAARRLTQKTVWFKQNDFEAHTAKSAAISLIGFLVIEGGKELGAIESVIEQPHQVLCTITMQGKEVLIPLHEASLVKIDRNKKQVHVQLPEGLLDLYLGV